ncbi:NACHT domain-containing protein [Dissophora ornata]|nr:NACHT domain-containing protein [Dissophora ornata]
MDIPLLPQSPISSQDGLRPVWDPNWHTTPKGILLKAVQDRDQRNANVDNLPAELMDIKQKIRSNGSNVKGAVDQIGADIQQLKANTRVISASLPSESSLEDIQFALKTYYARYLVILRVSGDELDLETCYVNLAIVEAPAQREKEKQDLKKQAAIFHRIPSFEAVERANMQSSIPLEQIFNKRRLRDGNEDIPKTILVQGRAGIGKTTLCKKLVLAHQTGLWRGRFDAVLWLPLRQLKAFKSRTLEGLLREKFFTQGLGKGDSLAHALETGAQKGRVLFILDGLDEIVTDTECDEGIALRSLLRTLLTQQHVVITSRPSGLDRSLLPLIDLELETVGFSQQNVKDFLVKALKPEAVRTVQDFIQQTPLIQGLVNIPVQLDVICFSWDSLPTDGPTMTMTGLYQLMVRRLWCKDALQLRKTAGGRDLTPGQISKLAPEDIDELMATESQHLGYLAFKGMKNNHQIEFNEKALLSALGDLREYRAAVKIGFLPPQLLEMMKQTSFLHTADVDLDASKSSSQQAWYFLHLTFQEYFAATWIAQHLQVKQPHPSAGMMTVEQARAFVQEHKYNPQYEIVWWMVAGLLNGEALEEFFDLLQGSPRDLIGGRHQQILASCLNEARARLDTTVVTRLDAELMKWLHFEIQTCHSKHGRSILGSQTSFPETLLVEDLDSVCSWKTILARTLGARSTLSESAIQSLIGALKDEDAYVRGEPVYVA